MRYSIYISGNVSGDLESVKQKFALAKEQLTKGWYRVINPMEIVELEESWNSGMEKCFELLDQCDSIYMLPCSVDSHKARVELDYAIQKNKLIFYEMENLEDERSFNHLSN